MAHKSFLRVGVGTVLASVCLNAVVLAASPDRPFDGGPSVQQSESDAPEVSLGVGQVVSGEIVFLSLVVFQNNVKVVKVISDIALPTGTVAFEAMERHPDQDPKLEIEAAVVPETKGTEREILRVAVASGRAQPLPEGTLVRLQFRVSPDAKGGLVDLKHTAQAVTVDGKTIAAAAKDGQLKVSEIAVYSCFFYMH